MKVVVAESPVPDLVDSLVLVAQLPLTRGQHIDTSQPLFDRHSALLGRTAEEMWADGRVHRVNLTEGSDLFSLFLIPTGTETGLLLAWDMSAVGRFEKQSQDTVMQTYRHMLRAATKGRLELADSTTLDMHIGTPTWKWECAVRAPEDIAPCRAVTMNALRDSGFTGKQGLELALAVSEAVTNAIAHGAGGDFRLIRSAGRWSAVMTDQGPGIDLATLPHATLVRGYSTKRSLGLGFTAMLQCVDRLVLITSDQGTTIVLQKFDPEPTPTGGVAV